MTAPRAPPPGSRRRRWGRGRLPARWGPRRRRQGSCQCAAPVTDKWYTACGEPGPRGWRPRRVLSSHLRLWPHRAQRPCRRRHRREGGGLRGGHAAAALLRHERAPHGHRQDHQHARGGAADGGHSGRGHPQGGRRRRRRRRVRHAAAQRHVHRPAAQHQGDHRAHHPQHRQEQADHERPVVHGAGVHVSADHGAGNAAAGAGGEARASAGVLQAVHHRVGAARRGVPRAGVRPHAA